VVVRTDSRGDARLVTGADLVVRRLERRMIA